MVQMLGVFAEFERATIVERTIAGMERKAAAASGPAARPLRLSPRRRAALLVPDPAKSSVVPKIFRRYAERLEGPRRSPNG